MVPSQGVVWDWVGVEKDMSNTQNIILRMVATGREWPCLEDVFFLLIYTFYTFFAPMGVQKYHFYSPWSLIDIIYIIIFHQYEMKM